MRFFIISAVLFLLSTPIIAQESTYKISVQTNYTPSYRLNYARYNGAQSIALRLSVYNLEAFPVEFGVYISSAYHHNASISYGISVAYILLVNKNILLKAGANSGRIKMSRTHYNVEVGGIVADDFHTTLRPFIELEWLFSEYISLYVQTGYRLLKSETSRVTKILERSKRGFPTAYKTTSNIGWYGSGFQFSVGLSLSI